MPETFIRITMSIGEAERIREVLSDAHFDDDAEMFLEAIEEGPYLSAAEIAADPAPMDLRKLGKGIGQTDE